MGDQAAPEVPVEPAVREACDERELVERVLGGDEHALAALVDRLYAPMARLARAILGDARHVDDVVQEAWLGILAGLGRFEGRASLKTWALRIVANRAKSCAARLGREGRGAAVEDDPGDDEPSVAPERFNAIGRWRVPPRPWDRGGDPESSLLQKELGRALASAIEALPAGQRAVVTLRDVEGLGADEVCAALEISEANQRVLLHRGRSRLRAALERDFGGGGP